MLQLKITNPSSPGQKIATLEAGVAAKIDVSIINSGNDPITLAAGASLKIYFPNFMDDAIAGMKAQLTDWTVKPVTIGEKHLELSYSGSGGSWAKNEGITFTITNVISQSAANHGNVDLKTAGFSSGIIFGLSGKIALTAATKVSAPELESVLAVTPQQDTIYISKDQDVLKNTLNLNLKNKKTDKPLFEGSKRIGSPRVIVSFTYGDEAGALAPAGSKDTPAEGSAWNINGKVAISEGNDWTVTPSSQVTGGVDYPQWILEPQAANLAVIQSGQNANITFQFYDIVSKLAQGHTQMIVQFVGFQQDEKTAYASFIKVIDLNKTDLLVSERGVMGFSGPDKMTINTWDEDPKIDLSWNVAYAKKVVLEDNYNFMGSKTYDYDNGLLNTGKDSISLKGFMKDKTITFTLTAYDGNGNKLAKDDQHTLTINYPDVIVDFKVIGTSGHTNNPKLEVNVHPQALVQQVNLGVNGGGTKQMTDQSGDTKTFTCVQDYQAFAGAFLNPLKNTFNLSVVQKFGNAAITKQQTFYAPYIDSKGQSYKVIVDFKIWFADNYILPNDPSGGSNLCNWETALSYSKQLGDGWRLPSRVEWDTIARFIDKATYNDLPTWQKNNEMPFIKEDAQMTWPDWLNVQVKGGYGVYNNANPGNIQIVGKDICTGFWSATEDGNKAVVYLLANNALEGEAVAISRKSCTKTERAFAVRLVKDIVE